MSCAAKLGIVEIAQDREQIMFKLLDLVNRPANAGDTQIEVVNQILGRSPIIARNLRSPLQQQRIVSEKHILVRSSGGLGMRKRHIGLLYLLKGLPEGESEYACPDIRQLLTMPPERVIKSGLPVIARLRGSIEYTVGGIRSCRYAFRLESSN
jgi:hypothetical protein